MRIRDRLQAAVKAWRFPGEGSGGSSLSSLLRLPGSNLDWVAQAGDAWKSSAAAIGIDWIAQSFPEARLTVCTDDADGKRVPNPAHPLALLWRRPNAYYGGRRMVGAVVTSLLADGNAYLVRNRDGGGLTRELVYVPHWMMEPRWAPTGTEYIGHYDYSPGQSGTQRLAPEDVLHLRYGLDPENTRKGLGPLKAQLRGVAADNEVVTYVASVLRNLGILGYVVSPADSGAAFDDPDGVKQRLEAKATGDQRGRFIVLDGSVKVDQLGFSPEQLALDRMAALPVERIMGALHIDPMAAGLTAEHSTFSNFEEARRAAWQNAVLPLMATIAEDIDTQLLPEFEANRAAYAWFDTSDVLALQDDQDALHARARQNFVAGIWKRSEAREETGRPVDAADDVYKTDIDAARAAQAAETQAAALAAQGAQAGRNGTGKPKPGDEEPEGKAWDWAERIAHELELLHAASA